MKRLTIIGFALLAISASQAGGAETKADISGASVDQGIAPSDWTYFSQIDGLTDKKIDAAQVSSSNTFSFDFPYEGEQRARLVLFNNPEHGLLALLVIEKGQFFCGTFDGCTVGMRVDDGSVRKFKISAPEDRGTTGRFIENPKALAKMLAGAKRLRIEATFFHQGSRVFDFQVAGFRRALK